MGVWGGSRARHQVAGCPAGDGSGGSAPRQGLVAQTQTAPQHQERRWWVPAVLGRVLPPLTTVTPEVSLRCSVSCEGAGGLEKHR